MAHTALNVSGTDRANERERERDLSSADSDLIDIMALTVLLISFGALRAPLRGVAPMTLGYAVRMAVS